MPRLVDGVLLGMVVVGLVVTDGSSPARPGAAEIPAANPLAGDQAAIREGQSWYRAVCSVCHGGRADGAGERGQGADLTKFSKGFKQFVETVKKGRQVPGRALIMPPWGGVLTDQQIYQIGAYLETLASAEANWKDGSR